MRFFSFSFLGGTDRFFFLVYSSVYTQETVRESTAVSKQISLLWDY